MSQSSEADIVQRVERLERQNRRLRSLVLRTVLGMAAVGVMGLGTRLNDAQDC